jgi:hypothetical protein
MPTTDFPEVIIRGVNLQRREKMRRIFTGFAVAAIIAVVPTLALAGNQEIAEQIAHKLRNSGQMNDYKIGVKCQDGTAWLRGRVTDEEQMNTALKLVFQTPGVTRVVNELTFASAEAGQLASSEPAQLPSQLGAEERDSEAAPSSYNPLRGSAAGPVAEKAQQPRKISLVKRLEAIIARGSEQDASPQAERLSSSFRSASVETVSAQESQEEVPQQMTAPQRARPMATTARAPVQMAMMQPGTRGPVAPNGGPLPMYTAAAAGGGVAPARYDQPCLPNYAWPSYAAYPNYAAVTYPKQYSPTAWPYIGPFYPYPQVPLGWRKVTLEWDDGWWFLDFKDQPASCWHR